MNICSYTISAYHEIIEHLITAADSLSNYGDLEGSNKIVEIIKNMYDDQMKIIEESKKMVADPNTIEKHITPSYNYIKEWLAEKTCAGA